MQESHRDAGLVREVGPFALAANMVGMVVGASIFVVPAALARVVGPYAPLAFIVCALAVGAIAICFAEGGSRVPTSGGVYGYVEGAFGPLAGYVAGTLLWVGDVLACGGIAAGMADALASLVPASLAAALRVLVIVGTLGGIAWVNLGGVARGARLVNATTAIKLLPLALFVLIGATAMHGANFTAGPAPNLGGLGRAMILGVFAFMGVETSLCASGEVAEPTRTIPRALALALLSTTVLYVVIQIVAQGVLGPALATSPNPLADALARISPALRLLMVAGAALAMLGYLASDLLGSPRLLFAFARDGLLPSALGRIHPHSRAPYVAILCYTALATLLALSGTFAELAVLSALSTAGVYVLGCAGAIRLKRRGIARAGAPLGFRWTGIAAAIGIVSMLSLIAAATWQEIAGLLVLVTGSVAVYLVQTRIAKGRR